MIRYTRLYEQEVSEQEQERRRKELSKIFKPDKYYIPKENSYLQGAFGKIAQGKDIVELLLKHFSELPYIPKETWDKYEGMAHPYYNPLPKEFGLPPIEMLQ